MRKSFVTKPAVLCGTLTLLLALAANQLFAEDKGDIVVPRNGHFVIGVEGNTDTAGTVTANDTINDSFNGIGPGGNGTITTGNFTGAYGKIYNGSEGATGTIGTVNLGKYTGIDFYNGHWGSDPAFRMPGSQGYVGVLNLDSNSVFVYNGVGTESTGTIDTANVNAGSIYNSNEGGSGTINNVTLTGTTARVYNGNGSGNTGTIKTATLNAGSIYNSYNGGSGQIENLIYKTGSYIAGTDASIGTLTLNGTVNDSNKTQFNKSAIGTVGFGANYGLLTVTANGSSNSFTDSVGIYGNSSATAAIDLTGANVAVNLKGLFADNSGSREAFIEDFGGTLYFADLFSKFSAVTGTDAFGTLSILYSDENLDVITLAGLNGWTLGTDEARGAFITYNAKTSAATPEPATVLMFGLGLAGVAALRRRKK